jgi:enoyl-CoA hydratase/carnithine racemase
MTDYKAVIVEKKPGGIGKITLNRPESLNAMNMQMLGELGEALDDMEADPNINVIIIAGAGKNFSAGRDLKEIGTTDHKTGIGVWSKCETINKPTIAQIQGYCLAGALSLMLCCDLAVAADDAIIGDVHAKHGIVHGGGATQRLRDVVGIRKAKELLYTCDAISMVDAERFGLVNRVVPRDQLEAATEELALRISQMSQVTVRTAKYTMNQGVRHGTAVGLEVELREYQKHRAEHTSDIKHNTDAFYANKRGAHA